MTKVYVLAALVSVVPLWQQFDTDKNFATPKGGYSFLAKIKPATSPNFFNNTLPQQQAQWNANWELQSKEYIRKSEYNFTWEEKLSSYVTPNRKNNFRFYYTDNGFSVEPRTTKIPIGAADGFTKQADIKYKHIPNWSIAFNLDKNQFKKGSWSVNANTAEYQSGNTVVQYINNDEGMRQNFIVQQPLNKKSEELKINFSISTKLKAYLTANQLQFFHKKTNVLNYSQLTVWDANKKLLPAAFKKISKNKFFIVVNTNGASYPITIDPLSSSPDNVPDDANQGSASFGYSVSSAGDVNGDGYSDIIAGAYLFDDGGNTNEGRAFVYYGSAAGLSASPNSTPDDADQGGATFGYSVATAGDINGDGYSDVIIGAPGFNDGTSTAEGRAFVYFGSAGGLAANPGSTPDDADQTSANFGTSVATAGDVNGDGYSDVIIGADFYNDGANTDEGRAFVYHGSAAGLSNSPNNIPDDANQSNAKFGYSVASAGDVNGDGYSDVIIGANSFVDGGNANEGRAFVYHGSAAGLSASPDNTPDDANQANAYFGTSVSSAGDVNGDGYSDVIIGADFYNDPPYSGEGRAFVYYGSATGLSANPNTTPDDADQAGAGLGASVACAGDINGDGYSDIIVGADYYDEPGRTDEGRAFVYFGSATGLSASPDNIPDDADQAGANFGGSVASAGDVNGDGYSDIIIGSPGYNDGANIDEGRAFVYHGSADGLSLTPNSTPDDADKINSSFGNSVAGAGDVNGDGFSDVIIGAYLYDNGIGDEGKAFVYHGSATGLPATPDGTFNGDNQFFAYFGISVAGAGDVNGDGYGDVIIGANKFDDTSVDEGVAYVYHGSATGLNATFNAKLDDANQAGCGFGSSVASAGDVNKDGFSDVIVGAPTYTDGGNSNEGVAFIYHGSTSGLSNTPNSVPNNANIAGANFGVSVASAGDVNGDGFSDVIIGASGFKDGANTDEGRAYVYYGSTTGLPGTPNTTLDAANQADAFFGCSVASAGDVNGDGYADVVIGAEKFNTTNTDEGRAFVYYGSAAGLPATPNTFMGTNLGFTLFGKSVATAGDVNGDGYSDVIVGSWFFNDAPNNAEGRAFVYFGAATGLSTTAGNICDDADQADAYFGYSVACAGDVNGDGYSDIIGGALGFNEGANTDEGRAFLYNGNIATSNKRNNLRMYNTDLFTPINSSNYVLADFGAGLFAKSFIGNVKAKMVWETRINYHAYSGIPITNSTLYTSQQTTYTTLGINGIELKNLITKIGGGGIYTKLRARVKYSHVTAITGQIYGPWRYVSDIIDGNKLGALPVELISFNASWIDKGKTAAINFVTDKENGIKSYIIEKSVDGVNYAPIAALPAQNISGRQTYNYVDNKASGIKQYYRLKIVALNGLTDYSHSVLLLDNIATEVLALPNPATDKLQLVFKNKLSSCNIKIMNLSGQVVKTMGAVVPVNQTITVPVNYLPSGYYLLQLQAGNQTQVIQFVKQ